jgi:hypothetical protein
MFRTGLAQTAIHHPVSSSIFDFSPSTGTSASGPITLLEVLHEMYVSPILQPVMPYQPGAYFRSRTRDALTEGRPQEIRRISALWFPSNPSDDDFDRKCEEIIWTSTLLLAGTGKCGMEPRLDFLLMHILNSSIFIPTLLNVIPNPGSKTKLLKAYLPTFLLSILIRGRPVINAELIMSYSAIPCPPVIPPGIEEDAAASSVNPWPAIINSVLHAPDSHTIKAIRSLCFAAQKYGNTAAGDVIGTFGHDGKETHQSIAMVDGTVFVRAAGVVMDSLGWVGHGQKPGDWDQSALGWEDAWKDIK